MNKNMPSCERVVRIVAGLVITSLAFWGPASPWFLLGLIPLITGLLGNCPAYTIFGINRNCAPDSCCCKPKNNPDAT